MALFPKNKILIFYVPCSPNRLCSPVPLIFRPLFPCFPEKIALVPFFPKTTGRASFLVKKTAWFCKFRGCELEAKPGHITFVESDHKMSQLMRLWCLSHRRLVKLRRACASAQSQLQPLLFAHMRYGSRRRVRLKIRHLAPLDGCTCAFEEWEYGGRKVP